MLEDLQDKANSELNELRAKEVLKQSRHVHCQTPTEAVVFVALIFMFHWRWCKDQFFW
jgi:hypothetical protein